MYHRTFGFNWRVKNGDFCLDSNEIVSNESGKQDLDFFLCTTAVVEEQVLEVADENYTPFTRLTAVGDTGASCHLFNDKEEFFDVKPIAEEIKGMTDKLPATLIGKRKIQVRKADGTCTALILQKCKYCPAARVSLFFD